MTNTTQARPRPARALPSAYSTSPFEGLDIDLWLAGNEGRATAPSPALPADRLSRYPSASELERALARRLDVAPECVLVTCGADDALLRIALAYCADGREMVLPSPTFEMIPRYVALAGGRVREVEWPGGAFPTDEVLDASRGAAAIAVVSPNNPTGAVASERDLERVAAGAPGALVVVDAAYAEFATVDLTRAALRLPNAVVLRTFSKAYGAAGLRVGYVAGPADLVAPLRAAGNPYPVSTPALAWALERTANGDAALLDLVQRVKASRERLAATLRELGADVQPSEANFVLARVAGARAVRDALAARGIAVRAFEGQPELADRLRIAAPTREADLVRLERALIEVMPGREVTR